MTGDYAGAIDNLKQAIQRQPTPIAYLNLAVAYKKTGEISEAIRYFELCLVNPEGEDPGKVESVRMELSNLRKTLK